MLPVSWGCNLHSQKEEFTFKASMKHLPFLFLITLSFRLLIQPVNAQIVNIERSRLSTDSLGWQGHFDFSYFQRKNTNVLTQISNDIGAQYRKGKHILLGLNNVGYIALTNPGDFEDISFFQHLRYTYIMDSSNIWAWEAFLQTQTDRILLIRSRVLAGTGPRLFLYKSKKFNAKTGLITMYEHEKERETGFEYTDIRLSYYLSFALNPADWLSFNFTGYYQPVMIEVQDNTILSQDNATPTNFEDFRISFVTGVSFRVKSWFSIKSSLNWNYDSNPVSILYQEDDPNKGPLNVLYQTSHSFNFTF